MSIIKRTIQDQVEQDLGHGKIVVIYGPRQIGKTTLVKHIQNKYPNSIYYNCDEPDIARKFQNKTSTELKTLMGSSELMIIDEAQRVKNIGLSLKLIIDNFPDLKIIATGSSSFDLANHISEPLTGRMIDYQLSPFTMQELSQIYSPLELSRMKDWFLIYGTYPDVVLNKHDAAGIISRITNNYLYKDILLFQELRNEEKIYRLLQALALQIGQEVSYTELARLVGIDQKTISKYIQILEKAFVIFRLPPLFRNPRKEISKSRKIYFYDNGVRNALVNNFNDAQLRNDIGNLFEQFIIAQRIATKSNSRALMQTYFWRTKYHSEIDYIEEKGGQLNGFEIKFGKKIPKEPKPWNTLYKNSTFGVVNSQNWQEFLNVC